MSMVAYSRTASLDEPDYTGVGPDSQTLLRERYKSSIHLSLPASRQESQRSLANERRTPVLPLLAQVEEVIRHLDNAAMRSQASRVVEFFRRTAAGYNLQGTPPLRATLADDASLLIEWTFEDRRLGFNIEPNQDDSGWYFVSSKNAGGRCASGNLSVLDINEVMRWTLNLS